MNSEHDAYCSSPEWAEILAGEVLPWGLDGFGLDGSVLELGGGFGASTAYLLERTKSLTVVEADATLAAGLADRFPALDVLTADATALPLEEAAFDTVVCFTMLHHVPSAEGQDRLFAEAARVLRPGGWFGGTDSLASDELREFHTGDVYVPVDPATLSERLRAAGFSEARADVGERRLRFRARR